VGEIYDQFDRDISGVQHKPDGALVLPGHFPSMTCPTWGGAAQGTLCDGEKVLVDGWWLEVDHNAIQRLRLCPRTQPTGESNRALEPEPSRLLAAQPSGVKWWLGQPSTSAGRMRETSSTAIRVKGRGFGSSCLDRRRPATR
jgi:hypothetical protein